MFGRALECFVIKAGGLSDSGVGCFLANADCLSNLDATKPGREEFVDGFVPLALP